MGWSFLFNKEKQSFIQIARGGEGISALSNEKVYVIYQDRTGAYWIGTEEGLNQMRFKEGQFIVKDFAHLPGAVIDNIKKKLFIQLSKIVKVVFG
ncbi:MAG: ligand-binding sensor domain-containing protein [Saprospiraceae bacterium]|jgi:ligand-binding sensor domain-containing protein